MPLVTRKSFRKKKKDVKKWPMFGVALGTILIREGKCPGIPNIVEESISFLRDNDAEKVEGIFRISGRSDLIEKLRSEYEMKGSVDISATGATCTDVSSLLKMFIRELPESLVESKHYKSFVSLGKLGSQDPSVVFKKMKEIVDCLGSSERALLAFLLKYLRDLSFHKDTTKMDIRNLAVVWAPNILRAPMDDEDAMSAMMMNTDALNIAFEAMIEHAEKLYGAVVDAVRSSVGLPEQVTEKSPSGSSEFSEFANESWWLKDSSRQDATGVLKGKPSGDFVVRISSMKNSLALSHVGKEARPKIHHSLISILPGQQYCLPEEPENVYSHLDSLLLTCPFLNYVHNPRMKHLENKKPLHPIAAAMFSLSNFVLDGRKVEANWKSEISNAGDDSEGAALDSTKITMFHLVFDAEYSEITEDIDMEETSAFAMNETMEFLQDLIGDNPNSRTWKAADIAVIPAIFSQLFNLTHQTWKSADEEALRLVSELAKKRPRAARGNPSLPKLDPLFSSKSFGGKFDTLRSFVQACSDLKGDDCSLDFIIESFADALIAAVSISSLIGLRTENELLNYFIPSHFRTSMEGFGLATFSAALDNLEKMIEAKKPPPTHPPQAKNPLKDQPKQPAKKGDAKDARKARLAEAQALLAAKKGKKGRGK